MSKKPRRSIIDGTTSREELEDPEEQADRESDLVAIRTSVGTTNTRSRVVSIASSDLIIARGSSERGSN